MLFRILVSSMTLSVAIGAMLAVVISVNWVTQEAAAVSKAANGMNLGEFKATKERPDKPILSRSYLDAIQKTGRK